MRWHSLSLVEEKPITPNKLSNNKSNSNLIQPIRTGFVIYENSSMNFPTIYEDIMNRIESINPTEYAKTRNHINGAVTHLSPYISRGVISTKQILEIILDKGYTSGQVQKFIQELAWREYFQRVWQHLEDDIFDDIRHRYTGIQHRNMPTAIAEANTGIHAIDEAIQQLYATGYMHNHLRMYTASITCNIGKSNWQLDVYKRQSLYRVPHVFLISVDPPHN